MLLEIGPGLSRLSAEWKTLDCVPRPHVDFVAKWGEYALPIADEMCELVYASHVAEHVPYYRTIDAFREVYRILKLGGAFEVWVPDFSVIVQSYLDGEPADNWRRMNPDNDLMLWICGRIFAYSGQDGMGDENWHRACFDEGHLKRCLEAAGFHSVRRLNGRERGHAHGPISLGMEAKK